MGPMGRIGPIRPMGPMRQRCAGGRPVSDLVPQPARILGIDPGLQITGYAVVELAPRGPQVCEAGVIRTTVGRAPADMAPRLCTLYDGLVEVLEQFQPQVVAVEQLYSHYEHPRTAILMGH